MKQIKVINKAKKKFNRKYPLIHQEDLVSKDNQLSVHPEWVEFVDESNQFIGYGYLGQQNKGFGWIVSFDQQKPVNGELITSIFSQAINRRKSFFDDTLTNAFRLFNGEGDGFGGITIDWYENYLVISWYNETIYSFKDEIIGYIESVLPNVFGIYEKVRFIENHNK